ncbi:hypothetical protein U9M48_033365 [Paspalum notatum var. saurae]|uniref:Uncharacterized protein n=1 Tax=Paspalum notatum var. saurae TaxID=547442 RepID=A0AAQ3U718_PASNO
MANQRYGYGSSGFLEVVQDLHPRGIPKSEARGGAGVAVNKVRKYLAKMDRAVDYDFYEDDDLRYVRFKSPFDRRPLIGRRPHPGKNVGKRTLRLVGSSNPDYMRQCEEAAFGDFDDRDDWEDEEGHKNGWVLVLSCETRVKYGLFVFCCGNALLTFQMGIIPQGNSTRPPTDQQGKNTIQFVGTE